MKAGLKQWGLAILVVVCLSMVGALVVNGIVMPVYTRHNVEVEVPEVVEMNVTEADSVLRIHGFHLVVEREQYDWNYPEGTVINQNPAAFSITKPGRRVYVTTSIGEKLIMMPNLVGKSSRDAIFAGQAAGLALGDESFGYEYSNYYPENVVMAQSIPPGTKLKKDTPVHVTVSLGTLPNEFRIPDVVGQTLERARKVILTSGLELGEIKYQVKPDLLPNTVISQDPPARKKTFRGAMVDLMVSLLEETPPEEDVLEESESTYPEPE
jgi:serine/threonine-protein kinase